MRLFKRNQATELENKLNELVSDLEHKFGLKTNYKNSAENYDKKSDTGNWVFMGSTLTTTGAILAVKAGLLAGPLGGAALIGGFGIATAAIAYSGITKLMSYYMENKAEKALKAENKHEEIFDKKVLKTMKELNSEMDFNTSDLLKFKESIKAGTSDQEIKEIVKNKKLKS